MPLTKAGHMAKLEVSGGREYIYISKFGQDGEVKMNWDQIIPLIIWWIMHVVWLNRHLAGEPGS